MSEAKKIKSLEEINTDIPEGRLLMAALAMLTTQCYTDKTPDEIIEKAEKLVAVMFAGPPQINNHNPG